MSNLTALFSEGLKRQPIAKLDKLLVSDSRIERRIQQIGSEVGQHDTEHDDHGDRLNQRKITSWGQSFILEFR